MISTVYVNPAGGQSFGGVRNGVWILLGLALPLLPGCKSSFEPTELTGFPVAPGTPAVASRPPANNSGSSGIKMKGDPGGPAPATPPPTSSTPTPEMVCNSMIDIVAAKQAGGVDANMRRQAMDMCLESMRPEQASRGAQWTPMANCIIAARSDADIDECDRRFPKGSGSSTGGITMKGGGAAPGGASGSSTSDGSASEEEMIAFLKSLFLTSGEVPAGLESMGEPTLQAAEQGDHIVGVAIWLNPNNDTKIAALLDTRYVFGTEQEAKTWLDNNHSRLGDGYSLVKGAPKVGQDCRVYSGSKDGVSSYMYLFRVGQIVMHMFVTQGKGAGSLKAKDVAPYAKTAAARLNG